MPIKIEDPKLDLDAEILLADGSVLYLKAKPVKAEGYFQIMEMTGRAGVTDLDIAAFIYETDKEELGSKISIPTLQELVKNAMERIIGAKKKP